MNLHTNYKVKPGVYRHESMEGFWIVKSILTDEWNHETKALGKRPNPLVLVEPMLQDIRSHKAYGFTEEVFLNQFHEV